MSKHHVFYFNDFPLLLYLKVKGAACARRPLTRATNRKKKQWKGHNELDFRFSDGRTKKELRDDKKDGGLSWGQGK